MNVVPVFYCIYFACNTCVVLIEVASKRGVFS